MEYTTIKVSVKFRKWIESLKNKLRRRSHSDTCDDIMRVMKEQPTLVEEMR